MFFVILYFLTSFSIFYVWLFLPSHKQLFTISLETVNLGCLIQIHIFEVMSLKHESPYVKMFKGRGAFISLG